MREVKRKLLPLYRNSGILQDDERTSTVGDLQQAPQPGGQPSPTAAAS